MNIVCIKQALHIGNCVDSHTCELVYGMAECACVSGNQLYLFKNMRGKKHQENKL